MPEEYLPPVVAVVVSRDPGVYLEECLASLGRQDYANLDVLVIDDASRSELMARIAAVLPRAIVRRRATPAGFAACANQALDGVEGATFFLFVHDDVALASDAVRRLVEEGFRSNAGVVGPKLVDWDDPERLLHVGLAVDRFGSPDARVDAGELDQSQHDEARDVFAVPAGCQLVRVDLFAALGGMDDEMGSLGEDVDLCWRARVAGARVVVAPQATARHLERSQVGERAGVPTAADRRDELRAVLKNYGPLHLSLTVTLLLIRAVTGPAVRLVGSRSPAHVPGSGRWRWNLGRRASLSALRRRVHESRTIRDSEVAARMASHRRHRRRRGAADESRPAGGLAGSFPGAARLESRLARRQSDEPPSRRRGLLAGTLLALAVLAGVRALVFGHLPLVGDLLPLPGATRLLGQYLAGRSDPGWRPTQVAPPAYAVVGLLGLVTANSSAMALKLLLLSGIGLGTLGVGRLVSDFGSTRARITAALALAASPVVWNSLARGDVQASVALAAMPFIFRRLAIASRLRPYAQAHDRPHGRGARRFVADSVPLGLLLAVAISLSPPVLLDAAVVAVAMLVASFVTGEARAAARSLGVASASALVAFACTLPWSLTWFQGGRWSLFAGAVGPRGSSWSAASLLRGAAGPVGGSWIAWGLLAAAAFALVGSRGARLNWAARWWAVIAASAAVGWAGAEGWLGSGGGATLVLLAPLAVGVAACCGLGFGALEGDLARYRFGWRQGLLVGAAACFAGGLLPGIGAAVSGRASLAPAGFDQILGWMSTPGGSSRAASRALWLGDPRALPGQPFGISPGLSAFAASGGLPGAATLWPQPNIGPGSGVAAAVEKAEAGETLQLGTLLAPYGIRYVVVPSADAPVLSGQQSPPADPAPLAVSRMLEAESDLRQLPDEAGVAVFENTAWTTPDGQGTLERGASSSAPGLRGAGVAAGLATVCACLAEGVVRRRSSRRGRPSATFTADGVGPPAPVADEPVPEAAVLQGAE